MSHWSEPSVAFISNLGMSSSNSLVAQRPCLGLSWLEEQNGVRINFMSKYYVFQGVIDPQTKESIMNTSRQANWTAQQS